MKLTQLKGLGPKRAEAFERLSIYDTYDLVYYYPVSYEVYEEPLFVAQIDAARAGKTVSLEGIVTDRPKIYRAGRYTVTAVIVKDAEGHGIKCKWYNMPYIGKSVYKGARFVFRGHISIKKTEISLEQPKFFLPSEYDEIQNTMRPVYRLTKGLSVNVIRNAVEQALEAEKDSLKDYLPSQIRQKNDLPDLEKTIRNIHFPKKSEDVESATRRLVFDEFFLFSLSVQTGKNTNEGLKTGYVIPEQKRTEEIIRSLPYELTNAQKKAWEVIRNDLASEVPMNRLLQGDVGSGKTIIAVLALINTVLAGFQGILMAPTEVLAVQEYKDILKVVEGAGLDIQVRLLTGSIKSGEKKKIYEEAESGKAQILVGTHALIQDKLVINDPGLVITDEQHRFGVGQRQTLKGKAQDVPNILVMSATPIPRTLAWILFADLDVSVMDELPAERKSVKNAVVDTSYREKAYRFIRDKVKEGRQIYVICPMVEESEGLDVENVTDYSKILQKELGNDIRVDTLHGRMKPDEKNDKMKRFSCGETDVLVSTTVVEVGVNVPNATVMMIENAERFGLSQLHQLRGRVGRGSEESYCIFVSDADSEDAKERLDIISSTTYGFEIAQKDLELRGPGDFFGFRQSGELLFNMADPVRDSALLDMALKAAVSLLEEDPQLESPENALLKDRMVRYMERGMGDEEGVTI